MKTIPSRTLPDLQELRIQARRLLKALRAGDSIEDPHWREVAARFTRLESFGHRSLTRLLESRSAIRLKHALTVLALEHGYSSWADLKQAADSGSLKEGTEPPVDDAELMYDRRQDVLLNRWFAHYDQARASLEAQGGYLFPYRNHFYICEAEGVRILGLDPDDPDWAAIGWNWVEPKDREAWERLRARRVRVLTPPTPPSPPFPTS
jgi:hypothetical protein